MGLDQQFFGTTPERQPVTLYTLTNNHGTAVAVTNFGGCVVGLQTVDRKGKFANIALGYESFEDYLEDRHYFGCIVGRCANRIANARFHLDGKTYALTRNAGRHHLHGGNIGFGKRIWAARSEESLQGPRLILEYESPNGEEGYPGNLKATVVYTLSDANALKIDYLAESDRATIVNMTHHLYFNLSGCAGVDCLEHEVMIRGDHFLPIDEEMIPSGEIRPVQETPMDFLKPQAIGKRIRDPDAQLLRAGGYDHTWVLNRAPGSTSRPAASSHDPISGRLLEIFTTQPGLQFYTGNQLVADEEKGGGRGRHGGFCFEAQKFPDAPHQAGFPSVVLSKGEIYSYTTIYKFCVQ